MNSDKEQPHEEKKPSSLQIILSVLSAAIGIQSSKNRERDFKGGSLKIYIFTGIVFVAIFIMTIVSVVSIVLENAK